MTIARRLVLALGVVAAAVALSVGWLVYGGSPVPDGHSFPRHSMFGGPDALYVGALDVVDGCIRTVEGGSFAVVWPPGSRLSIEGGEPVVQTGFHAVVMGEQVRMGGGYYEDGRPPPVTRDVGTCAPPFFLSTGFIDWAAAGRDPQGEVSSVSRRSMSGCWLTVMTPSCGRSRSMTSHMTAPSETTRTMAISGLRLWPCPAL